MSNSKTRICLFTFVLLAIPASSKSHLPDAQYADDYDNDHFRSEDDNGNLDGGPPNNEFGLRIAGGAGCTIERYPFTVAITVKSKKDNESHPVGAGVLVTLQWVLTAGCCVDTQNISEGRMEVTAGTQNQVIKAGADLNAIQRKKVTKGVPYDTYAQHRSRYYDVGLLMVGEPFAENDKVKLAKLPNKVGFSASCLTVKTLGWGESSIDYSIYLEADRELQCVELSVEMPEVCGLGWRHEAVHPHAYSGIICTSQFKDGKALCMGDQGGPLVCNGVVVGVVSEIRGCGITFDPVPNVAVEQYWTFIEKHTKLKAPFKSSPPLASRGERNWAMGPLIFIFLTFYNDKY